MPRQPTFANRRLRIAYWDGEARFSNTAKLKLQRSIQLLADTELIELPALANVNQDQHDLMLISGEHIGPTEFARWFDGVAQKVINNKKIWTPALVVCPIEFSQIASTMLKYTTQNWYFDVVHPDHFDSLPIRVANLIRIHDHLQELYRYDEQLQQLAKKVETLEAQLSRGSPS